MEHMAHTEIQGQEAFCSICPDPAEVTGVLQALGFRLTFQMPAVIPAPYAQIAPLPAQFHYQDSWGTEVIYLHGRDTNPDGVPLPEHASRFWAYPGSDMGAFRRATHTLATHWMFRWQHALQAGRNAA